jgi:hypothetical protein
MKQRSASAATAAVACRQDFLARDRAAPVAPSQWVTRLPRRAAGSAVRRIFDGALSIRAEDGSLWLIRSLTGGAQIGVRAYFDTRHLENWHAEEKGGVALVSFKSSHGDVRVEVRWSDGDLPFLRYSTWLTPAYDLNIEALPRDVCVFDRSGNPFATEGAVYAAQSGPTAGLVYFSIAKPGGATCLYFQNLTALSDYCERTGAEPIGRVSAEWPELGFSVPPTQRPLRAGRQVTLSDGFVVFASDRLPDSELEVAQIFLRAVSTVYREIPRPETRYFDWPSMAERTLADLTNAKTCSRRIKRRRYLNAYVGATDKPPESMVQLAVLVPLCDYEGWLRKPVRLRRDLRANIPTFADPAINSIVRWLPGSKFAIGADSEEEDHRRMDSWYYVHTLLNLCRLAEFGDGECRELVLASAENAIRVAHAFQYDWPVFYDPHTLAVQKAETEPGRGGEHDVPGLYAHLMLQLFELTKDPRYRDEAERAAQTLAGKGFRLLYQTNNTVMSAVALAKLWKATNNRLYLDLSVICIANVVARFWIWNGEYGFAKFYDTFMGVAPLQDAAYVAAYEEHEFLAAVVAYLKEAGAAVQPEISTLLSEYCKYLLHRGRFYFCSELPPEAICDEPKEGMVNRRLAIPLEDLRSGWHQAGQVGQEVYGSAAAFIVTAYSYINLPEVPFLLHSEYPILEYDFRLFPKGGELRLRVSGNGAFAFRLVAIPRTRRALKLRLVDGTGERLRVVARHGGRHEFQAAGTRFTISWGSGR